MFVCKKVRISALFEVFIPCKAAEMLVDSVFGFALFSHRPHSYWRLRIASQVPNNAIPSLARLDFDHVLAHVLVG